jgi:hypothetical protein
MSAFGTTANRPPDRVALIEFPDMAALNASAPILK